MPDSRGKYPIRKRADFPLDKDTGDRGVLEVVPGPRPYLWIGDKETLECFGTLNLTPAKLRKLRKALKGDPSGR